MALFAQRHAPTLLALFTSLFMSLLMSGVITLINLGAVEGFFLIWMRAFVMAFAIAFPAILLVLPLARRLVHLLTTEPLP